MADYDAIVVGSGHNGLARRPCYSPGPGGRSWSWSKSDVPGGASKSRDLTLPGFVHDVHAPTSGSSWAPTSSRQFKGDFFANGFGISAGDQPYASVFPDGDAVCGYMDPQKMVDELARHNPADAEPGPEMLEEFGRLCGYLLALYKLPMPSVALVRHVWKVYRTLGRDEFLGSHGADPARFVQELRRLPLPQRRRSRRCSSPGASTSTTDRTCPVGRPSRTWRCRWTT